MTVDVRLRWKGHSAADTNTDYKIYSDVATANTYVLLTTRDSASPYAPVSSVLAGAIGVSDTALTLADATNFANADYVKIGRETILLAGKNSDTFASVSRGQHNTVRQNHLDATPVYKMHETHLVSGVDFGSRHVIRYRIRALFGTTELTAAELVAVNPSLPETNDKIVIWGIWDDLIGAPDASVNVSMTISPKAFNPGTAETLAAVTITTATDSSGYWQLVTHRDVAKVGGVITVTVGSDAYTLISIPDQDTVCFLECLQ